MSRLRNVTTALAAVLLTAPAAMAYDIQMPGNDTKLSVYGFVYAIDEFYTTGASGTNTSYLNPGQGNITTQTASGPNNTVFSVQPSRYGFTSTTPTAAYGNIFTKIEFDMNNTTGSNAFHLRHAYASVGNFLMGLTYTNWIDLDALADNIEWQGPVGTPGFDTPRRAQIRYTLPIDKNNKVAFSAEVNKGLDGDTYSKAIVTSYTTNPTTGAVTQTTAVPAGIQNGKVPAFVASYTYSDSWGHIGVRGIAIDHQTFIPATAGVGAASWNKWTGGGLLSGDVKFGKDDLIFSIYDGTGLADWGYGAQSAVFTSGATAANGYNTSANQQVQTYQNVGWTVGYTHVFNEKWRANLIQSGVVFKSNDQIATTNSATGTDVKSQLNYYANVYYSYTKNAQIGVEYFYDVAKTFGQNTVLKSDGTSTNSAKSGQLELLLQVKF
ncbi:MAG: DcaP family trimeric outer membrane transporter [Holophaga sp.]|nr:DcaP family trimeric outer membrane transporter [Holophaga sp.]